MLSTHRCYSFAVVALLAGCSSVPHSQDDADSAAEISQALTSSELLVALRTNDNVHYLTAEGDGGGSVSANRTVADAWERFIISDLNGGSLVSGDQVQIRHVNASGSSWWLTADGNGGGVRSVLRANRTVPQDWETFVISKVGGGAIGDGNQIHLQAVTHPFYVSALKGGGLVGDRSVVVDRTVADSWETFTLLAITPSSLCPFSNALCLFDQANFEGQRFNVSSLNANGTCVNLVDHGWGARARSAINTNTSTPSVFPNADCTGHPIGIGAFEPTLPLLPNSAFVF
jgi:hypothetical protein